MKRIIMLTVVTTLFIGYALYKRVDEEMDSTFDIDF